MHQREPNQVEKPLRYFDEHPLDESLVLRFWYNDSGKEVDLVVAYAHEFLEELFEAGSKNGEWLLEPDAKAPDCFQRFRFVGVEAVARRNVAKFYRGDAAVHYCAASHIGTTVIETLRVRQAMDSVDIELFMGSFGVASFSFQQLYKQQRSGVLCQIGAEEWEYRDIATGEAFSDEDPFGVDA